MGNEGKGVLFGVDYYPEQWDRSLWESDARRMREMGIKAARLMEFAWVLLEPREGKYDFSLFDEAIDVLAAQGIGIVLGTPTATFPYWLYEKDPAMVQVNPNRMSRDFGARREGCYNAAIYRKAAGRIVKKIAKHYGKDSRVIGWQIDNEIGHEGSDRCVCDNCARQWGGWLRKKYATIDALNRAWGTVFWGTTYSKFDQVPVPRDQVATIQNPSLYLDYYRFCSDSATAFTGEQVRILRKHIAKDQWITTNLYPAPHAPVIDMEEMLRPMDIPAYDNYPVWGDQDEPLPYFFISYALSYIRGLKDTGTFAILEQFSGFQGHVCLGYLPPEKQAVLWTDQAIARGADKIFYFRWRTAAFAQEQLCYGILDSDNSDTSRYASLRDNIREKGATYARFADTPFESQACLVYDKDNSRLIRDQYLSKGLYLSPEPYMQVGYDLECARQFAPTVLFNVNTDVKSAQGVDLSRYKLILLPLYQMASPVFVKKLEEWVRQGGHLVLGFRAGARDEKNHAVSTELPGLFAEMAGITIKRFESLNETKVKIRVGMIPAHGEVWADQIIPGTARPIARYTDRKKHYRGMPCATVNEFGKGKVYYFGTTPGPLATILLYRKVFKAAGLRPKFYGMGIEAVRRTTTDGKKLEVILNHTARTRWAGLSRLRPYSMISREIRQAR
ncbi:MAG: beta-galactosidase [Spirochaetes bacterium]|nr:MAG: beta-galactosidase [Spirochaetota bacterium]